MKDLLINSVILQAIELGFDFSDHDFKTAVEIEQALLDFFNEKSEELPQIEDECEVTNHGYSQSVNYEDYSCSGEICRLHDYAHKSPDTKIYHSDFIKLDDGIMKRMNLYSYVGETELNVPDGFFWDAFSNRHVIAAES